MLFQVFQYLICFSIIFSSTASEKVTDWRTDMICKDFNVDYTFYSYCYNVYESKTYQDYNSICNPGFVILEVNILKENLNITILPFWLPFKRKDITLPYESNAINSFTTIKDSYLTNIAETVLENTNCLIYDDGIVAVDCNEYYAVLCIYELHNRFGSTINNCEINKNIYKNSYQCYKREISQSRQYRYDFCDESTLAEPYDAEEYLTLLTNYEDKESSHIGIEYEGGLFRLSNSRRIVDYVKNYDPKIDGKFGLVSLDGLIFDNYVDSVNLAYCQISMPTENGKLRIELKASPATDKVSIVVENMLNAFNLSIFCYEGDQYKLRVKGTHYFLGYPKNEVAKQEYFLLNITEYPRYYQCEATDLNGTLIQSNILYTYSNFAIKIYNVIILTKIALNVYPVPLIPNIPSHLTADKFLLESIYPKKILNYASDSGDLKVLFQFATNNTDRNENGDFNYVQSIFDQLNQTEYKVEEIYNTFFCSEDKTTDLETGKALHWPRIRIKTRTVSDELCIDENYHPVWRSCDVGKNDKPVWSAPSGSCKSKPKEKTEKLDKLLHSNMTASEVMKEVSNISFSDDIVVTDIHLMANIFHKISAEQDFNILDDVLKTLNHIILSNRTILKQTQAILNSTDLMLDSFDNILKYMPSNKINEINFTKNDMTIIGIANTENAEVVGFGLSPDYELVEIKNRKLSDLEKRFQNRDLLVATFFSRRVINEIQYRNLSLIVAFFQKDALFNEDKINKRKSVLPVVDVQIPDYQEFFKEPLSILYYTENKDISCSYWEYGLDGLQNSLKGQWNLDNYQPRSWKNNVLTCNYNHLTHFGMLVSDDDNEIGDILSIITIIGCSFSLGGVIMILTMALISQKWRNEKSSILFFNFIFAIILTYVLFFISGAVGNGTGCKIVAILLHYSVISQFAWTLILSYFQYNKFVVVFNLLPSNAIFKSALFAWISPTLPIAIVCIVDINLYHKVSSGLCYVNGLALKLAVLLPIAIILTINFLILLKIIYSLTCNRQNTIIKKEWKRIIKSVGIMSVFLGFNWILGIALAFDDQNLILSLLFSISSTMQGFIICLTYLFTSTAHMHMKKFFSKSSFTSSTKFTSTDGF